MSDGGRSGELRAQEDEVPPRPLVLRRDRDSSNGIDRSDRQVRVLVDGQRDCIPGNRDGVPRGDGCDDTSAVDPNLQGARCRGRASGKNNGVACCDAAALGDGNDPEVDVPVHCQSSLDPKVQLASLTARRDGVGLAENLQRLGYDSCAG